MPKRSTSRGDLQDMQSDGKGRVRLVVLILLGLLAAWLAWEALTWPDVSALAKEEPETTAFIEHRLAKGTPVVRVMSNTPVLVDEAMSAISAGSHAAEEHLARFADEIAPLGDKLAVLLVQLPPSFAFDAVSGVLNDFETTITSVVFASSPLVASAKSSGSTLAQKRISIAPP